MKPYFAVFKQVNHNRENPDTEDPVEPTNDDSDSSDEDSEDSEASVWTTDEENDIPEDVGNDTPNETPSNNDRVPGAAILTSFVPLQLVAHLEEGQPPVVLFDNELCNSPLSGEFLGCAHPTTS